MPTETVAFGPTPLGQAIFNVYVKHGRKRDFFKVVAEGNEELIEEIKKELAKLEKRKAKHESDQDS